MFAVTVVTDVSPKRQIARGETDGAKKKKLFPLVLYVYNNIPYSIFPNQRFWHVNVTQPWTMYWIFFLLPILPSDRLYRPPVRIALLLLLFFTSRMDGTQCKFFVDVRDTEKKDGKKLLKKHEIHDVYDVT